jgi:type II secretion system protein H
MRRAIQERGRAGFTLTELVVVLVIMGIMAAMIIPQMQGSFEVALLRSNARKIISVLSLAHSQAVSHNQARRVRLDGRRATYLLEKQVRSLGRKDKFSPVQDSPGSDGKLDPRISIEVRNLPEQGVNESDSAGERRPEFPEPADSIVFFPDGTAEGKEIWLQDRSGARLVLQVSPVTAGVRIMEPESK